MQLVKRLGCLRYFKSLAFASVIALTACGGSGGDGPSAAGPAQPTPTPPPTLQSIEVTAANPSLAAGTTLQFAATAIYSDQSHTDVTRQAVWTSSSTGIATVEASAGLATGVATGTATIGAGFGGRSGETKLTVTPATVVSLAITPASTKLAAGTSQQLAVTGIFTDGTKQDVGSNVSWTSSKPTVATVDGNGLAKSIVPGQTSITASCKLASVCGAISASATLDVSAATVVALTVSPPVASIASGFSQQLAVSGVFTDNTTQDLGAQVSWSSSNTVVAAVDSNGLANSQAPGRTTLTVTCRIAAVCGNLTSSATLDVTTATLVSIAVTPAAPTTALGTSQALIAAGTYTDGTVQVITGQATWTSSVPAVATVSNASGSNGLVTSASVGTTSITASMGSITSAGVPFRVTAATLSTLTVSPSSASIAAGLTQSFIAVGVYSNNTTQVLTNQVTWASSVPAVATVSNAAGSNGAATTATAGSTVINAVLDGVTSTASALTVTPATLVSMTISPPNATVATGNSLQYTATGTYTDGSTQNLTGVSTWTSSDPAVSSISSSGLATALADGTVTISAAVAGNNAATSLTSRQLNFTTPGAFTWTVPTGVTSIQVVATGGGGGGGSSTGGNGGTVTATLTVVPNTTYNLFVAGGGSFDGSTGAGGGSSNFGLGTPLQIIAGGGGGGGLDFQGTGGDGGGAGTAAGTNGVGSSGGGGGNGGIGGVGGTGAFLVGATGGSGNGGAGGAGGQGAIAGLGTGTGVGGAGGSSCCGGGGGGGYGGGGGSGSGPGTDGGGGGGGSTGPSGSVYSVSTNRGTQNAAGGNGSVIITTLP